MLDFVDSSQLLYTNTVYKVYTAMSQVISFRASGHFLNWLESQQAEGESVSQCCQRILKDMSADVSTVVSTEVSTRDIASVASTEPSTILYTDIEARFTAIEERLGKLRA